MVESFSQPRMVENWEMIYCNNCGYESHCGTNKMKDFRRSPYNHGIEGVTEVCKYCRCEKCTSPDWGQGTKRRGVNMWFFLISR